MSEKEQAMLRAINPTMLKNLQGDHWANPVTVLRMFSEHCFIENLSGPAVESLRRCYGGICHGMDRGTPEYEALIQLEQ